MADPRLQWRALNTAQPNVAGLMRGANDALNNAGDAAAGILERYDSGQKTKGDQELARLLASTNDRESLTALVNSDAVTGLNLSEDGIKMLNEAQGNRVDWANTDSTIRDRDGRLVISQNIDGRQADRHGIVMREDGRMVSQRDWLEENSGQFFDAERQALTGGTAFSSHIDRTESGGGGDQYDTLYGHRNRQNGVQVSQMTLGQVSEFSNPNGEYAQSVNKEIGRVATPMGKFQIVGTTLRGIQKDLGLPDDVPFSPAVQEQMGLYLAQKRVNGPRSQESMRDGLRAEWEGFKNLSDAELDVVIDEIRSSPPVSRDSILAAAQGGQQPGPAQADGFQRPTTQTSQTGFGGDNFTASMAASGQFTPQEILSQVDPLRTAGQQGDALIAQEDAAVTADLVTGITQNVVSADGFTPGDTAGAQTAIQEQLLATEEYSTSEAADLAAQAIANIEGDAALMEEFNRGKTSAAQNAVIEEALGNAMKQANRGLQGTDQYRALNDIPRYEEDPAANLDADLGISGDPETPSNYRPENLRRMVNDVAAKYGVPPAVAAVALRDAYNPDPAFIRGQDNWSGLGWDLTPNSLENRFDQAAVEAAIGQLTPERQAEFDRAQSELQITETRLQQNATQQRNILGQLNRLPEDDPRRKDLQERLDRLIQQAADTSRKRDNLEGRS